MDALIGYTGFVGSSLIGKLGINVEYFNSKNIEDMRGKVYKNIYCCGLYAEKWKVNKNPEEDRAAIKKLTDVLDTVSCEKFFLISTIDVLESGTPQSETSDYIITVYSKHAYGVHRREMETWCSSKFKDCFIFRLPALFGPGLKKNALYDMINNNNIDKLRSHWVFQWYNIEWLYDDIHHFVSKNVHLVNLVTEPIALGVIKNIFFPKIVLSTTEDSFVNYIFGSDYRKHTTVEMLEGMALYLNKPQLNRLLVSEMAWEPKDSRIMNTYLQQKGIRLTEAVPSKWNWDLDNYSSIYSAQSLLFGMDIQIFKEQERFLGHIKQLCERLSKKNTKVLIFGSPKQRIWSGENAKELFLEVGDICKKYNMVFCIENNSKKYGCNWMYSARECLQFVKELDHDHIGMNFDIGNMILENEEVTFTLDDLTFIEHIQISFDNLGIWDTTQEEKIVKVLEQLQYLNYSKNISLEMKSLCYLPFKEIDRFVEIVAPYVQETSE
jgi:hypothetical protein